MKIQINMDIQSIISTLLSKFNQTSSTLVDAVPMAIRVLCNALGMYYIVIAIPMIVVVYYVIIYVLRWVTNIALKIIEFIVFLFVAICALCVMCHYIIDNMK